MNWHQMLQAVDAGTFFVPLRTLSHGDRLARLRWTPLFKTVSVWNWFKDDPWIKNARGKNEPDLWPYLALLLERYLLNLDTRHNQKSLLEFWDWAVDHINCPIVRGIWDGIDRELKDSALDRAKLKEIDAQERRFASMLRKRLQAMRGAAVRVSWAEEVLRRIASHRNPADKSVERSVARVVFAWDGKIPEEIRPSIIVDLELGVQCQLLQHYHKLLTPETPFDRLFKEVLKLVAHSVGSDNFHQLIYRERKEFFSPNDFPRQVLTGESGGLAVFAAQRLANPSNGDRKCRALPPWVCITAKVDTDRSGEISLSKVAAIRKKVEVLREEGIRVLVVADDEDQIKEAKEVAGESMKIVPCFGDAKTAILSLISSRCTWVADLSRFKPPPKVDPKLGRRRFLQGTAIAIPACIAVGAGAYQAAKPKTINNSPTLAMQRHEYNKEFMRLEARNIISGAARNPTRVLDFFNNHLHAFEFTPGRNTLNSKNILFDGLTILHDSKVYDSSDWVKVQRPEDVKTLPVEPAYFTRVLELRKNDLERKRIIIAFDTGGYAVVPLPDPDREGDRVYYRLNKEMREARGPLRTTYLDIDISKLGNDGKSFPLMIHAIYFNGTQEQIHGRYRSGLRKRWDWWGSRVLPGTMKADLAIILPEKRAFRNVTYMMREDDDLGQSQVPAFEVQSGDPEYEPAGADEGSYIDRNVCVWRIPCDLMAKAEAETKVSTPWIFSIQWKWA